MQNSDIVSCQELNRTFYSAETGSNPVLQNINFGMTKGEFVVLIGPSGCGKSTLLNIIAGFDKPSSGQAKVDGAPIAGPGPDKAMVFQDYALLPWLNARDNVAIGLRMKNMTASQRRDEPATVAQLAGSSFRMTRS